jgi:hypothetical protein
VAPLVVLGVLTALLATPAPAVAPVAFPWCSRHPAVPAYAYAVEEFVRSHNGSPPKGYVGGRPYQDKTLKLPPWQGPFREYDVHVNVPGQKRDDERIVLGPLRSAAWYTSDHYGSFVLMHPWGCVPILS